MIDNNADNNVAKNDNTTYDEQSTTVSGDQLANNVDSASEDRESDRDNDADDDDDDDEQKAVVPTTEVNNFRFKKPERIGSLFYTQQTTKPTELFVIAFVGFRRKL